jgi:hypothetical protein
MKRVLILAMMVILFFSFSTLLAAKKKTYDVNILLEKVSRESLLAEETQAPTGQSYRDDLIQITWKPEPKKIEFILKNHSGKPISIIWQDSYFLGRDNIQQRVVPANVKPDHMQEPLSPLEIPAGGEVSDWFFPERYYSKESKLDTRRDLSGRMTHSFTVTEWVKKPLYTKKEKLKKPDDFDFAAYKADLEKNTFEVFLLIRSGLDNYDYHFFFKPDVTEK